MGVLISSLIAVLMARANSARSIGLVTHPFMPETPRKFGRGWQKITA